MKIGFDAKRAVQNNTGLGNYSRYIIEIMSEYFEKNSYLLFAPKNKENIRLRTLQSRINVFFHFPVKCWKYFSSLWRIYGIKSDLKSAKIDIFHGLSNELPIGISRTGIKSIVSIHDLIFLRYPQYYKLIDRMIYKYKFRYACRNADKIIAISECTKRDIISFFDIPEEKITVVYQGCHPAFSQKADLDKKAEIIRKYSLPSQFILYVGSIEDRKNLLLIVKSLKYIDNGTCLVAIGKKTPYQTKVEQYIQENHLSDRVLIFNSVPFEDLPSFYQLAQLFIYPSFFEGFGIPVIEALSSGIPVIAATGSCLEEAGGKNSAYIDPNNEVELADKINLIMNDNELAKEMSESGKKYAERFSDQAIANAIMNVYQVLSV